MKSHSGATAIAHFGLAEGYLEIGDYASAKTHARQSIEVHQQMRSLPSFANLGRIALEKARLLSHQEAADLERLPSYVRANRIKIYQGWSRRYLGEILMIIDDQHFSEAQHWIEQAMEADERNGMRWALARDIAVYAELFKRKGEIFKAKEQLGKAIDLYKECVADGWVTRAEEGLTELQ